ncbi:2'-5' RNA ligase family protein [Pseudonocardia sp. RS11V-5]|uniref:2'-5' RNA ligase family protein n=1 Tax=Pseudonocardia terrae TaxID=2905831 RepID=UPI001E3C08A0|nr:2'-5' RNA ligase family protein [Pseudonocardia terrae]MCE3552808.1 2'-5' RNA ligase family protein [Pseudonocardia terrae]
MAQIVRFRLDMAAEERVVELRDRLAAEGLRVPHELPTLTFAAAALIPAAARVELTEALRGLTLPSLWLPTLGSVAGHDDDLVLSAIVDTELLAVHSAVHDALAGKVRSPFGSYLPGAWLPHVVLAHERPADAFALLHPVRPVRASIEGVEIADTRDGSSEPLFA